MKKLTIVLSLLAFLASTLIAQNDIPRFSKMGPQIIKHDTFSEQYLTSEREHKFNYYDETEIEDINMSVNLYSDNSFRLDSILGYDYYSISNGLDWKKEYTYDSNGNLTLWIWSNWDTDLNDWELSEKYEYTYASNGNLTLRIRSVWNTGGNWDFYYRNEYTYDSNGNLTLDIESIWDTDLNDWGLRKKYEYTFDSNGNLTLDKESWWDTDLNDWEVHWKSEYYWSIPSEVGELNINDIFTVFPNPTSGNLSIKGEVFLNQHVILEMTNLRGQSVYSNKLFLTNIDHNIILPKLPKGMYLLTIKANSINSTQKIFIE